MRRVTGNVADNLMGRVANAMTSFDEVSVAVPSVLFDLKSIYPLSRLRDRVEVSSGGTVTQADAEFAVQTDSTANSEAKLQSSERARYVAGFDGLAGIGLRVASMPTGNQEIEWGNTDFVNGFAVGIDADGMFVRLYSGGEVVTEQRRENWTFPRADELDPQQVNVYRMQYRWYGSGPYRLSIAAMDPQGRGTELPVTSIEGDRGGPVTLDPNQPIAIRARNLGTTGNPLDVRVMGRQYFVMGDYNPNRRIIGEFRLAQSVGTTFVPLIAFRTKNSVYRSISTKLAGASIITSGADVFWQIRLFSELTGGTWVNPRNTDAGVESAVEFNLSATAVDGEGIQIFGGDFATAGQGNSSGISTADLPRLDLPAESEGDIVALVARSLSGTATVSSAFRVREEWAIAPFVLAMLDGILRPAAMALGVA